MKIHYILSMIVVSAAVVFIGCGGGGENNGGASQPPNSQAPQYNLSGDQLKIISDYGNPEYLTISVNNESGKRVETWTYAKNVGKIYIFWDGERVKENNVNVNSSIYYNPPYIDPKLFTKDTKKTHIIGLFGKDYSVDDQSKGALLFETLYYTSLGLAVSFSGDNLVAVQTLDKP